MSIYTYGGFFYNVISDIESLFSEDEDDEGGASPFDDENDLQDLVEDAIYRFPLGDHDTGNRVKSS